MLCFLGDSLPAFSNLIIGAARGVMLQAALLLKIIKGCQQGAFFFCNTL